jgi:hexosaminidase
MKNTIVFFIILVSSFTVFAQKEYSIIPYPNKLVKTNDLFEFKSTLTTTLPNEFKSELGILTSIFVGDYNTQIIEAPNGNLYFKRNENLEEEAYKLTVSSNKIEVEASTTTGCFWAVQTIRQLMKLSGKGSYTIAGCHIEDQPAYKWRSFMLDEARNFKGKEVVKELLDQMALLKFNVFHWHLTDDQGWRIEIKKYPLLTEIGAWRDSTQLGTFPSGWTSKKYDPYAHGGFYSQDDIKKIIAYAAKRHITIMPEIEMPGHASAAIAAYPWLGGQDVKIKVPSSYGDGRKDYAFNVADPKVYDFIENVLKEIISLFPGPIIHIGGDEVNYEVWKTNEAVNTLMKSKGFKNYSDVQIYFTNRISSFIDKNGKRMMGWNEIMGNVNVKKQEEFATTSLAKSSIVQFWKGDPKLINDAIEKGYDVVNSDNTYTYLDYTYKEISLEKAYSFTPAPERIDTEQKRHILGMGCQMWGEWIPKVTEMYLHIYPRIAAYAEDGWTDGQNKNFDRFKHSLLNLEHYWDRKGISYDEEK